MRKPGQGFPYEACWAQICADAQNSARINKRTSRSETLEIEEGESDVNGGEKSWKEIEKMIRTK